MLNKYVVCTGIILGFELGFNMREHIKNPNLINGVTMKIKEVADYIIDDETGETYRVYKNSAGEPIGKIIRVIPVINPITYARVNWYTVDFDHGIGEFTVSEKDEITDDRLRDIALYKRECIQQELNNLSNQETRLRNRLSEIDKLLG